MILKDVLFSLWACDTFKAIFCFILVMPVVLYILYNLLFLSEEGYLPFFKFLSNFFFEEIDEDSYSDEMNNGGDTDD